MEQNRVVASPITYTESKILEKVIYNMYGLTTITYGYPESDLVYMVLPGVDNKQFTLVSEYCSGFIGGYRYAK